MSRYTRPEGHLVTGNVVTADFQFETHKNTEILKSGNDKRLLVHAANKPKIELDLNWLPAAAESYHISPDPEDYILVALPIVTADIPNRNSQGFQLNELAFFDGMYGCMVYETFNRKCLFSEHDNEDPTKSKGVIVDSSMQFIPKYNVWKINIVTLWDRTKDINLVQEIIDKKRTGYSMGSSVMNFVCSICGKIDNMDHTSCSHMKQLGVPMTVKGKMRLPTQWCAGTCFFETSSVMVPADPTALSQDIFL